MDTIALDAMLKLVSEHVARERNTIEARAPAEARRLVAEAWRSGRARLHENINEIRAQLQREIAQADAALDTARRQHRARCEFALLDWAAEPLRAAVLARWRDPGDRRAWVERLVAQARAALPAGDWEIVHADGWPAAEREALGAELARTPVGAPRFRADAALAAGLRIGARGAWLDGTLDGLLADRDAIHGRLLAEADRA